MRPADPRTPIVVLGEFDGFHRGHRRLVDAARTLARRRRSALVGVVLDPDERTSVLTPPDVRCRALIAAGVDVAHVVHLPRGIADADAVVDEVAARTSPATVVMSCPPQPGDDSRYPSLRTSFDRRGIPLVEVDRELGDGGRPITATRIRDAVAAGRVDEAASLLGSTFVIEGVVQRGQQLGRTIGFPTANVDPPVRVVLPATGVYAAHVDTGAGQWRAAVNIGTRPTVDSRGRIVVEAHLLDFDADLYGARISIAFHRRLRDERRFDSLDALIAQLALDVAEVRGEVRGEARGEPPG